MICPYCGGEARGTKEHIISSGVLDLFSECFMTIDVERKKMHLSDPMIGDVCVDCNHKISYIDAYAKETIKQYFMRKYDKDETLEFVYNFTLIQKLCLKYAFNDLRAGKKDFSFFNSDITGFLLEEENAMPLRNITIMAGLAINTSPAPDYVFGNKKLRWGNAPLLLSNSIIKNINYTTGAVTIRENNHLQKFDDLVLSYMFRFNSLQILLLCWDEDISKKQLEMNCGVLQCLYPYVILNSSGSSVLSRCTSEVTYHYDKLIDVTWGQGIADEMSYMRGTFSEKVQAYLKAVDKEWQAEEKKMAEDHPRK